MARQEGAMARSSGTRKRFALVSAGCAGQADGISGGRRSTRRCRRARRRAAAYSSWRGRMTQGTTGVGLGAARARRAAGAPAGEERLALLQPDGAGSGIWCPAGQVTALSAVPMAKRCRRRSRQGRTRRARPGTHVPDQAGRGGQGDGAVDGGPVGLAGGIGGGHQRDGAGPGAARARSASRVRSPSENRPVVMPHGLHRDTGQGHCMADRQVMSSAPAARSMALISRCRSRSLHWPSG